ncbi:MAG: SusC/RagA family TonB-linked outer membrane protein [Dysgonamonadaceae bacterium]|jgi:TonB-linked SusC/RagA family outer membrane protein|nr:SusC/RagA family TonB-linked outer membrane protein [Dysgonamonadaceae bacterium]
MKRLVLLLTYLFISTCVGTIVFAQTKTVAGTVLDEAGEPVIGATVIVTGFSSIGTASDLNGAFTLSVPANAQTLTVSYIGMVTQTVAVAPNVQVVLKPDAQNLEDVIVVAYGTALKRSYTGSAQTITAKQFEKRPLTNITNAIEGNVLGVQTTSSLGQPGESAGLRIRGFGSINASNAPLIILDGAIYNGALSSINMSDIESYSVLKDASATALYGSSAGNGVIILTSKKGTTNGKINLTISQGFSQRAYADYDRVNIWDYFPLQWQMRKNAYITAGNTPEVAATKASAEMVSTLKYNPFSGIADGDIVSTSGLFNPNATQLKWGDDLDWEDAAYRTGHRQQYDLNYSSASEKSDTYSSIGYVNEEGYMIKTSMERYSARLNHNIYPVKWFKGGLNVSASRNISNYSTADADNSSAYNNLARYVRTMAPIYPIHKHDLQTGAYLDAAGNPTTDPTQYVYDYEGARLSSNGRDGIAETEFNTRRYARMMTTGRTYVTLIPVKGLNITANYGIDNVDYRMKRYENPLVGDGTAGPGRLSQSSTRSLTQTFNQIARYEFVPVIDHTIKVMLGHESYDYIYEYIYGMKTSETIPNVYDWENFSNISSLSSYTDTYRKEGYLAQLDYNFLEKYYFLATYRRDGTSRFAPDKRWGDFYSVGVSWRLAEEPFFRKFTWIDNLKLRASYGETGNDLLDSYYPYQTLYLLGNANSSELGAYFETMSNPLLTWETQISSDVALEFGFLKRLTGSVEFFQKKSKDLLFDVSKPTSTGVRSISDNIGDVVNKGLELGLDYTFIKTKDWTGSIGINATALQNKIKRLPEEMRENGHIDGSKKWLEGRGRYDFWLRQWYGVDPKTGNGLYYLDTKAYNETDETLTTAIKNTIVELDGNTLTNSYSYAKFDYSGSSIPKLYGGVNLNLGYKDFSLQAIFSYAFGAKVLDTSYAGLMSSGEYGYAMHTDVQKAWQKEGDITTIPRLDFTAAHNTNISQSYSTRWLVSGDYVNFRSLNLSYSIPANLISAMQIRSLNVNIGAENLFLLTARQGLNPQGYFTGLVYNDYKPAQIFTFGLNLSF